MKFAQPPPFAPNCDFSMNVTDCRDEKIHFYIYIIGAAIHCILIFVGFYIIARYRQSVGDGGGGMMSASHTCCGRFVGQPLRTMTQYLTLFLIVRLTYNTMCTFDTIKSLSIRSLIMPWSYVPGFWGITVFAAGIIETVQMTLARLPHIHSRRITRRLVALTPPRILTQCIIIIISCVASVAPSLFSYVGGLHGSAGDWEGYFIYIRWGWCIWGIVFSVLCILYIYYVAVLTAILRKLMPQTTMRPVPKTPPPTERLSKEIGSFHVTSSGTANDPTSSMIMEAEVNERSQGITRLRRTLFHLLYCYIAAAITSFLWGIGAASFVHMPVVTRSFWVFDHIILWPLAAGGTFWYRWQMERAREVREKRQATSSANATVWPTSP
ncbi:hypothetical protein BDF19DRAFT_420162 [Syncephalis fuscata]|nr:hypothetical protein BDF19DRAFT_420162 [Syncephalis fuscata]